MLKASVHGTLLLFLMLLLLLLLLLLLYISRRHVIDHIAVFAFGFLCTREKKKRRVCVLTAEVHGSVQRQSQRDLVEPGQELEDLYKSSLRCLSPTGRHPCKDGGRPTLS